MASRPRELAADVVMLTLLASTDAESVEKMAFDPELVASMEESEMMAFDFSPTASNAELVP